MLVPIFIIAVFLLLGFYTVYLVITASKRKNTAEMRKYGRQREEYIYSLLCKYAGSGAVINNLWLPVPTKEGIYDTEVDAVCITYGGIAVIETKGNKGLMESPPIGKWCQRYKSKVMYFDNPHNQNRTHVNALKRILEDNRLSKVHVYNIVVFSDDSVQFTHEYNWLIRADNLKNKIDEINRQGYLTDREIKKIKKLLKYYRRPHNKTFKEKFRKRRKNENKIQKTK